MNKDLEIISEFNAKEPHPWGRKKRSIKHFERGKDTHGMTWNEYKTYYDLKAKELKVYRIVTPVLSSNPEATIFFAGVYGKKVIRHGEITACSTSEEHLICTIL